MYCSLLWHTEWYYSVIYYDILRYTIRILCLRFIYVWMKDSVHEACENKKNGLVRSGHKGTLPKANWSYIIFQTWAWYLVKPHNYFQLATTLLIEHLRAKPTVHNEPHAPHRYFSANLIASISSYSRLAPASNLLHVCAFDITCMQELFTEQAMAAILMLKLCTIIITAFRKGIWRFWLQIVIVVLTQP